LSTDRSQDNGMRTVLFYRRYRRFHGGHLKVWDYFSHVLASPEFTPRIEFSLRSKTRLADDGRAPLRRG
jgi:hypothetical protein